MDRAFCCRIVCLILETISKTATATDLEYLEHLEYISKTATDLEGQSRQRTVCALGLAGNIP
jgi:hypothetical protein